MDASGLWSFVYFISFQVRQNPVANHHFSGEKSLLLCGSIFLKKTPTFFPVWDLVTTGKQIKKNLFCHWKNTSTLWRTWSLALSVHNFFSHLHFFKVGQIKLLKYGNLMLPAGQILYIYCVQLSNAAPFRQNYTKLSFDAKHLEKGFNRGWVRGVKFLDPFFKKKCPFWSISNAALNF